MIIMMRKDELVIGSEKEEEEQVEKNESKRLVNVARK